MTPLHRLITYAVRTLDPTLGVLEQHGLYVVFGRDSASASFRLRPDEVSSPHRIQIRVARAVNHVRRERCLRRAT